MGDLQGYPVQDELAKVLKPIPAAMVRLITLKQLQVRGYWMRPVIEPGETGPCPCCGDVQPEAAFGICGGCYDPCVRGAMFGSALLDHLARRADIDEEGENQMGKEIQKSGGAQQYVMRPELAAVLKPIPEVMIGTITLKNLTAHWLRPLMRATEKGECPCCGGVYRGKACGVCSGCYDPASKKGLSGPELLEHLFARVKFGKKWRPDAKKDIEKTINPAIETSSPSATLAAGELMKSFGERMASIEGAAFERVFRIAMGIEKETPTQDLPKHLERLMRERDNLRNEHEELAELLGSGEDGNLRLFAQRRMTEAAEGATAINKVAVLTEEVATLKKSISPASESSSPAATPLAVAGQVESKDPSMQLHFIVQAIRMSLGLDDKVQLSEIPKHIDKLIDLRVMLDSWHEDVARVLFAGPDENLPMVAARRMAEGAQAKAKVAELTEEIATLNRLLATQPMEMTAVSEEFIVAKWSALPVPDGYESLTAVLHDAIDQAANGKGLERHADDRPFHDQPIMRETQAVGLGFPAGQARKKILEAVHCCDDHPERAVADLLGAINYTAATVIALRAIMVESAA